jgi:uncharacterized protein YjbI with pentapeptide repeats
MYIQISQLNGYDVDIATRSKERWEDQKNEKSKNLILDLIRKGGGEDFLQWQYQEGTLKNFLDNEQDLKGITLFSENIDFPKEDNFENIDFSYGSFYHSTFKNACFNATFSFTKIYNCKFINCLFHFAYWYGCAIENTTFENCDFVERHKFTNCDFINCKFINYSISELLFTDCRFDSNTIIANPKFYMVTSENRRSSGFNKKQLTDFYRSLHEGYHISHIPDLSRKYKYISQKSRTDYCSPNKLVYIRNKIFIEYLTGYGLKPIRPLFAAIVIVVYFSFLQGVFNVTLKSTGLWEQLWEILANGFWFSITAFNKIGNISEWPFPSNALFIIEACLGTIFFSLFITTLSNSWFTE